MTTHTLTLLGHTFTCLPIEGAWRVHDAADRHVTDIADPRRLTLPELAALTEHIHAQQAQARRRCERQQQFGRRVAAVIAAHHNDIVTVGALSGRLYSLPQRAQFNWGKAFVRAELRAAPTDAPAL